jgi:hypothetical protein
MSRLERAERKGRDDVAAVLAADLAIPDCPPLQYLWSMWARLRNRQPPGFGGPGPIAWVDIAAFMRCTGTQLNAWEIGCIELIDDAYLREVHAALLERTDPEKVKESAITVAGGKTVRGSRKT